MDIGIKVGLQNAGEAQKGLDTLNQSMQGLNKTFENETTVLQNLQRVAEEHRRQTDERAASTQKLKDHTAELVRKIQEEQRVEEARNSVTGKSITYLKEFGVGLIAGAAGALGLGVALKEVISAGMEFDLTQVRLEASLKATGNAVGLTQKQLNEMAETMQKGRFDGTAITQAQSVLLTFNNVSGELFGRTIQLSKDLAEKIGVELPQAARMLGRAMQEPAEGVNLLNKHLGGINPQIEATIKKMDEMGDSVGARALLLEQFESKLKGFSDTVGDSAPMAMTRFQTAWHNLFEEIGKGVSGPSATVLDVFTRAINGWSGAISRFSDEQKKARMDILIENIKRAEVGSERWIALNKRMQDMQKEANDEEEQEEQRKGDAILAAKVKEWEEQETKAKAWHEKQLKENDELAKKIEADEAAHARQRIEMMEIEVKNGEITLEEKKNLIEQQLAFETKGTQAWMVLSNARISTLKEIDTTDKKTMDQILQRYDIDIKAGYSTYQQKIAFIDDQLKYTQYNEERYNRLMKERQATEAQQLADFKRYEAEKRTELTKTQRSYAEQAEGDINKIRHTIYPDEDARIAALEELARGYKNLGEEGEAAYDKIQKAIRNTETVAERDTKRMQQILGKASFDVITVIGSIQTSWANTFSDMFHGSQTFAQGLKSLWKGIIDAIISEISRMVARYLLAVATMKSSGFGPFGGGGGGFSGGGFFENLFGGIQEGFGIFSSFGLSAGAGQGAGGFGYYGGGVSTGGGAAMSSGASFGRAATGGNFIVTSPKTFMVGEGGFSGPSFANGTDAVFSRPTLFQAGEGGPERVRVTPLAGGVNTASEGKVVNNFNGPVIMDQFSWRRYARQMERLVTGEQARHG